MPVPTGGWEKHPVLPPPLLLLLSHNTIYNAHYLIPNYTCFALPTLPLYLYVIITRYTYRN